MKSFFKDNNVVVAGVRSSHLDRQIVGFGSGILFSTVLDFVNNINNILTLGNGCKMGYQKMKKIVKRQYVKFTRTRNVLTL